MRNFHLLLVFSVVLSCNRSPGTDDRINMPSYIPRLEKILVENILSFWLSRCVDERNGGYWINYDRSGVKRPGTKLVLTQARMLWLFSRSARSGYRREACLGAARHGYNFLRQKMWDAENGGFYWETDSTGRVLKSKKHLYGQAFALYALSEYYLACGDSGVLDFTDRFFHLLENKAHDKKCGGYFEDFYADWRLPPAGEMSYMRSRSDFKLMNTHLHLMEALTVYYRAVPSPLVRRRLRELVTLLSNTVVRKNLGACTDRYRRDWTPVLKGAHGRVSYGHDLENIWLIAGAVRTLGIPTCPYHDTFRALFENAMRHGYDRRNGGFYYSGPPGKPSDDRDKSWWVQAEAIVSALTMYRLTGDGQYLTVFEKTFDLIESKLVDWQAGEWFSRITPDGNSAGGKAHGWKAGYHNGRAMMVCMEIIQSLDE